MLVCAATGFAWLVPFALAAHAPAPGADPGRADPRRGAVTFAHRCARCHGASAHGDPARAIPALAGQRRAYLVRELASFAAGSRESAAMHRALTQRTLHDPRTWADVADYLHDLPPLAHPQTGSGAHAALGRGIFREQCASCHGYDARGDARGVTPSLRNQHYAYLAAQMRRMAGGGRHDLDENLERFLRSFDATGIDAVADYLSRLTDSRGQPARRH
ncbi:MAG TPA: c-type cytochrome [Ideonella sp.]|nr:c-type cytochrome [Ideonella sp.]